jgi:cytidylate kinase
LTVELTHDSFKLELYRGGNMARSDKTTLGGGCGTGKGATSTELGRMLNLEPQSAGSYKRSVAKSFGISLEVLLQNAKRIAPNLDADTDDWQRSIGRTHERYLVEGRLSWYFLPESKKILLICEMNERARRVAKRHNEDLKNVNKITENQALQMIIERDAYDMENYQKLYHIRDYTDPKHYDYVIDTTSITPLQVATRILAFLGMH